MGSVRRAAEHVGMARAPPTGSGCIRAPAAFAKAWDAAIWASGCCLSDIAMERVREGTPKSVWYKGEQVGEELVYSDKLLMFMLNRRNPFRYESFSEMCDISRDTPDENDQLQRALVELDPAPAAAPPADRKAAPPAA